MIVLHPCTDDFDKEQHTPYIEFVHDVLPQTRDAVEMHRTVRGAVREQPRVPGDVPQGPRLPPQPSFFHVVLGGGGPATFWGASSWSAQTTTTSRSFWVGRPHGALPKPSRWRAGGTAARKSRC